MDRRLALPIPMDWPQDNEGRLAVASAECGVPAEVAFAALSRVERWPEWYPDMVSAQGSLAPGRPLRLVFRGGRLAGGGAVEGRIEEVIPPRSVTFSARRSVLVGFYTFRVAEAPGGGCRISASAFFTGARIPLLTARLSRRVEGEHRRAVEALAACLDASC